MKKLRTAIAVLAAAMLLSGCEFNTSAPSSVNIGNTSGYSQPQAAQLITPASSADDNSQPEPASSSLSASQTSQSAPDTSTSASGASSSSSLSEPVPAPEPTVIADPEPEPEPTPEPAPKPAQSSSPTGSQDPIAVSKPKPTPPQPSIDPTPAPDPDPEPEPEPEPDPAPDVPPQTDPLTGSILNDYTAKWAYNHITATQQKIYRALYSAASTSSKTIDVSTFNVTSNDLSTAYWAFDYDNPQFLELGSGYSFSKYSSGANAGKLFSITIDYGRSSSSVPQAEFDSIAEGVLSAARAQNTDYERLKFVHDWIINNTRYSRDNTYYETEADGVVVYGSAVCEGYSKAFMYFAQSMGFPCVCVVGTAGGDGHMWNMVKLNGNWYNVDVTWDDPIMTNGTDALRYDYFLVSDSRLSADHKEDNFFSTPIASYSYGS